MSAIAVPIRATPGDALAESQRPRSGIVGCTWEPPENMEHREWVAVGRRLGGIGRVSNWWVGDWLRYGTSRWGEKYVEAAKITGFDAKTLRNIVYVASRFELSRRRDNLTWSHHAELAVLEREQQDLWLDRAIADRLSVADLRQELRGAQGTPKVAAAGDIDATTPLDVNEALICPHCGKQVPLPPSVLVNAQALVDNTAHTDLLPGK